MQASEPQSDDDETEFDPEFDAIVAERDAAQAELAKMREQFLREHAELENTRKRLARDVEQSRKFANERLLGSLLPVFDSLEAGIAAAHGESPAVREGLELTLRQLSKVAQDNGMTVVAPLGQPFNPEHAQAIAVLPASEQHPPGTVIEVHQKGYLLNERLLRPALVIVAKSEHD
ncbi:MAG: nucleotide exchange factor GrpE [Proteobacteria bacterium]|nr:nucleotide exchange factor GrpE [Pseudomonadota bacterium]MBS0463260.1 nucleotide exchange factor GrpE [Pseudomonadota bacterium]MBS0463859.1 nucleotide exchange factor GrpE [Pseudomonadota bacterium]